MASRGTKKRQGFLEQFALEDTYLLRPDRGGERSERAAVSAEDCLCITLLRPLNGGVL